MKSWESLVIVPWCTRKTPTLPTNGIDHHLEDVREHVLLRVGLGAHRLGLVALALHELRRIALGGIGHQLHEDVEQLRDAGAVARRDEAHRDQVALAQRLLEGRVQLLRARPRPSRGRSPSAPRPPRRPGRPARCARPRPRRNPLSPDGLKKQSTTRLAAVGRQVDRQAFLAEGRLELREQPRQVHVLGVDLVDDDHAAEIALPRPLHHAARDHLDAVLGVHHDGRGLHRGQRADRAADEVGQPGRVDEVDARIAGAAGARPTR